MTLNDSHRPKPKLRWYQFSLRTLLVFVFLVSLPPQVTDEGVKKLQQALPNCKITH